MARQLSNVAWRLPVVSQKLGLLSLYRDVAMRACLLACAQLHIPSRLVVGVAILNVLPQQALVLLVHADCLLDGVRLSGGVCHGRIKVVDVTEAVAAKLERVCAVSKT